MDAGCMTRDEPMVGLWMTTEEGVGWACGCLEVDLRMT